MPTKTLTNGHKHFKSEFQKNENLFVKLAKEGQFPQVLWIGCSDSRVIPEQIMGTGPGELFVHRNIANIIPPQDSNEKCTSSVLEYAVNSLKVTHIVICGHTECGGIKGLLNLIEPVGDSPLENWLKYAQPVKEIILSKNNNEESKYLDTIKENVLLQKEHLLSYSFINEKYNSKNLFIHSWLYDLHTGKIASYYADSKSWITV